MNVRELAETDLAQTLEDTSGAGSPFTLIDKDGNNFRVTGTYGDIGFMLDNETGLPVQGRTITATYRMSTLLEKTSKVPTQGWRVRAFDLSRKEHVLFVVNYEPDRTMGIARLKLATSKAGNSEK